MTGRPFDSVLVANRGEIARRIIRTLRRLGIRSIAVYSDADAGAPHVTEADEAMRIGPAAATASYLDVDAVVGAAVAAGAQAIHPGYGFLSENAAFARACTAAGIVLVGPGERALEVMGDKIRARDHVARHGVPIVPGFGAAGMTASEIAAAARVAGFPLLVKPSAGGGGKGMQVVRRDDELADALVTARRVAAAAFGDDTLLLERLIERPRHIEVQVLADADGHTIHLGERECTLQRRHQKVIEEAPSSAVDADTRARLGAAACAAAASVDYRGAGTVEFLVPADRPGEFFFIEMNTRLQVEHPVTELVTGIDLVEQQLRIAAGQPLALSQDDVRLNGHAVEGRVYAESPERGFLPSTGEVIGWRAAPGVRTDAAIETGSVVTSDYDPMIAKVIAWAPDRPAALDALDGALSATVLLGVESNLGFLRELLADPAVRSGRLDTGLIGRRPPYAPPAVSDEMLAAVVSAADRQRMPVTGDAHPSRSSELWRSAVGWRLGGPTPATRDLELEGELRTVAVGAAAAVGDATTEPAQPNRPQEPITVVARAGEVWFATPHGGRTLRLVDRRVAAERRRALRSRPVDASDPEIRAPMPGAVVAVHVADGDRVGAGDRLVTVEAMKMEHPAVAPHDGVVVLTDAAAVGARIARGDLLARVEPTASVASAGAPASAAPPASSESARTRPAGVHETSADPPETPRSIP